jgi:hypothetical protein
MILININDLDPDEQRFRNRKDDPSYEDQIALEAFGIEPFRVEWPRKRIEQARKL